MPETVQSARTTDIEFARESTRRLMFGPTSPTFFGIVLGLIAVGLEAFFTVQPPSSYGICVACHGRDLINSAINTWAGTDLAVAQVSIVFPVLTVVGLLLGAFTASTMNREFKVHIPAQPIPTAVWGFLTMNFALLAAGCTFRLVIRATTGEFLGIISLVSMLSGMVVATIVMRKVVTR